MAEDQLISGTENFALCRCGRSQNAPYCDGAHVKVGFDGTETASRSPYREQSTLVEGPPSI